MNANEYKSKGQTKLLVAVAILAMVVCAFAVAMPYADAVEGDGTPVEESPVAMIGDDPYNSLDEAIAEAIKDATKDNPVTIELTADAEITKSADLTNIIIVCGTYNINIKGGTAEAPIKITNGTITGTGLGKESNGDYIVQISSGTNVVFEGTGFQSTAFGGTISSEDGKGLYAYFIITSSGNAEYNSCKFTSTQPDVSKLSDWGAIYIGNGVTEINGGSISGEGKISYGSSNVTLRTTGIDIYLQIPSSMELDLSKIDVPKGDVIKTFFGWGSNDSALTEDYTGYVYTNPVVTITNNTSEGFDFGEMVQGNDKYSVNGENSSVGLKVQTGDVTAYGGNDKFTVDVDNGAALTVPNGKELEAKDVNVAGSASGTFTGTVIVTSPDADISDVTAGDVTPYDGGYNALADGNTSGFGITGSWKLEENELTLENYTGNCYFSGDFTRVVLNGENKITINADAITEFFNGEATVFGAINSSAEFTISSGENGGSLTVEITSETEFTVGSDKISAIHSDIAITVTNVTLLTIDVDVPVKSGPSEGVYGLHADGNITVSNTKVDIDVNAPAYADSPTEIKGNLAFAISGPSSKDGITFTNVTGTITGGNRGIQTGASILTFSGCDLTISGSEKAIQANTKDGKVIIENSSNIVLELFDPLGTNTGQDDRFGIKVNDLAIESGSILVTDGMRLFVIDGEWTYTNEGIVIINGGYSQDNDEVENISGLYVDGSIKVSVNVGIPSALADGVTYVENGAYVASQVTVIGTTTPGDIPVYGSVDAANEALKDPSITEVTIAAPASGTIDISGLDTNGKIVNVGGTVEGTVEGTTGTIVVSSAKGLTVGGVSFDSSSKVTVTYDTYGKAILTGTVTAIDLKKDETVTVNGTMNGTVTGAGSEITFNNVSVTNAVLTGGSVEISGDYVIGSNGSIVDADGSTITENDLVIAGNTTITGTGTINVGKITVNPGVTLTIGSGVTIKMDVTEDVHDKLIVSEKAVVTGEGTIELLNGNMGITNNGTIDVEVVPRGSATASDVGEFVNALPYYNEITVDGEIEFTVNALNDAGINAKTFTVDNEKKITVTSSGSFTVGKGVTLEFTGLSVVDGADDFSMTITEGGTLVIDNSDIFTTVDVRTGAVLTLRNCETTITGATTDVSDIGFGKTVTFSDGYTIGGTMKVYGTVSVPAGQTLSVSRNAVIDVTATGAVDVAGTLNMNGVMFVHGAVDVVGTTNVTGKMFVSDDVTEAGEQIANVDITGTMNVTGTLAGAVDNYGTVVINGTINSDATVIVNGAVEGIDVVTGATVNMYGGAALNVEKATGTLTVTGATDYKEADGEMPKSVYNAELTLTGVSGLNVVANESIVAATKTAGAKITMTLDISGSVTAGTIATELIGADSKTGAVTVENTLDVAKDVSFTFGAGKYTINGTVNFANGANVNNNGTITVVGEIITVGAAAVAINGTVNAAYYDVTTPAVAGVSGAYVTRTYTSLANAVGVTNADKSTIYLVGTLTVAAGETVEVPATLKVGYATGFAKLTVEGTLVFADYENGCLDKNVHIYADVMFDEAPARTYTSLANAIDMGVTKIVLNDNVTVFGDLTIPAGVTVSSDEYGITVTNSKTENGDTMYKNSTLTVEGAIELTGGDSATDNIITVADDVVNNNKTYIASVVLSGNGYMYVNDTNYDGDKTLIYDVSGAYYQMKVKLDPESSTETLVNVIATVDRAAADSANVYVDNTYAYITIFGKITTQNDLVFTAPEDATLNIALISDSTDIDAGEPVEYALESSLTASSITLNNDTMFITSGLNRTIPVTTVNTVINYGFSSVAFDKVVGTVMVGSGEVNDVVNDAMYLDVTAGTVTVEAGQVNILGTTEIPSVIGTADGKKAGAELVIAAGATAVVGNEDLGASALDVEQYATLTVEGTLNVYNTDSTVDVDGTMDVSGTVGVLGTLTIDTVAAGDGKLNIVDGSVATLVDDAGKTGTITINGVATVGEKPTEIGQVSAGSLVGATAEGGYVKAYSGANVKMAVDETTEKSTAQSTAFNIRAQGGEYFTYMTVYVSTDNDTTKIFGDIIFEENFALTGYDTGLLYKNNDGTVDTKNSSELYNYANWYTSSDRVANTALTGDHAVGADGYTALYTQVMPVEVTITVSEGTGLSMYIDGVAVDSGKTSIAIGTHTVRFDVQSGYNGDKAVITFAGQTVSNGGTFEVTVDSDGAILSATGAVPAHEVTVQPNDDMSLTDILLIVLVILIVIMAIIVALRMMRS